MVDIEVEQRLKYLEKMNDTHEKEHKEIYKRLNEKDIADGIMRQQLDTVVKTTNRIEQKIDEREQLPQQRWNTIVTTLITAVVSAIAGGLIGLILQ